ncbi:phytoene desaturase family protein [Corynebacterium flavescens]|uniref:phytoene desaturase family protein n=1 Tax=Corynebacterium flavescens TaxID=28028 RepID=UPI002648D55F|nr:phytoene desaturase family protein [Corynebacterium flavescens]MDN6475969.1 phytoene desaturase family protein [Corynebacterium flavescens]
MALLNNRLTRLLSSRTHPSSRSDSSRQPESVVVIGAGVAGLATAALLARDGKRVTVVDKQPEVGGRAGTYSEGGFRWDTGPSWYLMPEAFDHFFELCGTTTDQEVELVDLSPAYRVYSDNGSAVDVETGIDEVATLFESLEEGGGARVREYLNRATDAYNLALARFLYTTFSDPRELAGAAVRRRLGTLAQLLTRSLDSYVSSQFRSRLARQILSYPAVFLSSQPRHTPALYSLMSHTDLVEGVRYPRGGFTAVVEAIARQARDAGVDFLLGQEVTAILTAGGDREPTRATGVQVLGPQGPQTLLADAVVSAADLHHTETELLPPELRSYPEEYFARREPGLGTVLLLLGVRGELPELAHHTLLFSQDWDPDFRAVYSGPEPTRPLKASRSIYVSKTSASDAAVSPAGHENLFVLVPTPAEPGLGHGDAYRAEQSPQVKAIADAVIAQIAAWADIPDLPERIVVCKTLGPADFAERYHAWSGGSIGPSHTLSQSAFLRGSNRSARVDNLYYAGATTVPGVGVPMCLISAENVLKRMHGDTTTAPLEPSALHGRS